MTEAPLWTPDPARAAATQVVAFMHAANARHGLALQTYHDLHAWSVTERDRFWDLVWDYCGVIGDKGERRVADPERMPGARFFPEARLNYAENLLRPGDRGEAIV